MFPDADILGIGGVSPSPFGTGLGASGRDDSELAFAVARAHHRWLADLCSTNPDRRLGIATVPAIHDVPTGVEEIERAYGSGVRGGVMIPSQWAPMPTCNDPIYDPIWAACQERDMVVAIHSGGTPRDVTMSSGMIPIFGTEAWFFAGAPAVAADLKRRVRALPGPEAGDHVERRLPGAGHAHDDGTRHGLAPTAR